MENWKISSNSLKERQIKTEIKDTDAVTSYKLLVSGRVFDEIWENFFLINYLENVFENRVCDHQWGDKQKLFVYLEAIGICQKCVKFGCKGFDKTQNEALTSERAPCCRGQKFTRFCLKLTIKKQNKTNASFIHTT